MQKFEVQKRGRKTFEIVRVGEKIESRLERIGHELRALEDADFHGPEPSRAAPATQSERTL